MPVKDKVALMESWSLGAETAKPRAPAKRSTSNLSARQKPTQLQQNKVQFRGQTRVTESRISTTSEGQMNQRRSPRESRHRRSMSDPNLHKSFQAMKQLWDKKVESDPKSPTSSTRAKKTRGASESSNKSTENEATSGKYSKGPSRSISAKGGVEKEKRKGPPTPTKPKPAHPRKKEDHLADVKTKANSNADQSAGNLVKNRAKMFDSSVEIRASNDLNKKSFNRGKNRSATVDEVHGVHFRKSVIENSRTSPRHTVNNNEKNRTEESKSELARLLDYEESSEKDGGDDLMSKMRRNSANLAKERRRNIRRGSNHSDSDSSCSAASSLSSTSVEGPVVLRRDVSKEHNSADRPGNTSPVIKSYLHRRASPKPIQSSPPSAPKVPPRRGSLGSSERRESVSSIASSGSISVSAPVAARRQSSLHREHISSSIQDTSELEISPTAALHRKLSIDAVKRASMSTDSGTGTVCSGFNRHSRSSTNSIGNRDSAASASESFKRGGSFSSVLSTRKTPPAPPPSSDKPTRTRSASASPVPTHNSAPMRPNVPPPPPPASQKRSGSVKSRDADEGEKDSMGSTTTISSRMSLLSGIGDGAFNAEDEYNRILDVIATPSSTQRYGSGTPSPTENVNESPQSYTGKTPEPVVRPAATNRDSLEVPSRKSRASDNDSCSDYEPSDADDEGNQMALTPSAEHPNSGESTPSKVPVEVKLHNIARELLTTEVTYVDRLHLIDQIFHKRVVEAINKKQISSDIKNIFSNVSAIYQFHSEFLLPQLKARLETWNSNPKIGDILTQAAPFLKMYSLYVQNFDEAMTMVKHWSEKSNNFANIIKQTQAMEECGSLSLQHHMLGPVQRIPRYKMLLEDYLKRLPEDSLDRSDAETALQLISQAATHSNESMRQNDKFNKLLSIYNNLVDINFDIVDVSRELIKEGKIIKISARNGEKHERHLYLFNDMLLCCTPVRRLQRKSYKVTAKIDLDGMEISEVNNMTIPNTFCVNGTKKSMEFAANSPEDKEKWVKAIYGAIDSFLERKTSFMKSGSIRLPTLSASDDLPPGSPLHTSDSQPQILMPMSPLRSPAHRPISFEEVDTGMEEKRIEITCTSGNQYVVDIEDHDLGKRAPRWIKDNEVTMCMNCSKAFNRLLRRRHHCRACGRVICTECSDHKLELQYEKGKTHKVCNKCHAILTGRKATDEVDKRGVLEIEADIVSGDSVISEYLYFTESEKRRTWTKVWCVIPKKEPCLYVYGANQDVRALMTMPLPGFEIVEDSTIDREFSFKLVQARKVLLFAASSKEQKDRWKFVFEKAGLGENLTREAVYNAGKSQEQFKEELQGEVASRLVTNGSRLSSSSAESSNTSSSDSSRPISLMEKNNSYTDLNGQRESILGEAVTS